MSRFKILDGTGAAEVEKVGSSAVVASAPTLSLADVSEAMLDDYSLAKATASLGRGNQLAKAVLEVFVFSDVDGAATVRSYRALRSQATAAADL